ncbi:hypothetical protein [uncultured Friedmanniella sp.]|uniref:hypothetical protein n=1 Tax=uncultured Friedmanniella sp. TaxID=335381 RepID=UPI0035CAD931
MYLVELVGALRRLWWAVVIGLLATAALTYAAFALVPAEQEARASLMVLPTARAADEAGNPYLVLGGLEPAADMLAAAMNSGPIHDTLAPAHGSATFEVSRDTTSSGPMLLVDVTDSDPARALALLDSVVKAMPEVLSKLQAQVGVRPTSNLLTLTEVTRDTSPEPSIKKQLRATLAAAVGGLALTVLGTNALDGLLRRRSASKSEPQPRPAPETEAPEDSDTTWVWADSAR